jgi:predicted phage terminase large subunit-like protein
MVAATQEVITVQPQDGPQTVFLSTPADIAVYGGAAGGGKTWAILAEPLRHYDNPKFSAVIFRRTYPMIESEGGLWEESGNIYPLVGGKPRQRDLKWNFPTGMSVRFAHMQHEDDKLNWQGAQIPFIGFDELTHFTESQFFYMLSRNRSISAGIKGYVRATCNPDALSWVKKFLAPWVDRFSPVQADSGELLYMVRDGGHIKWYRSKEEAITDPDNAHLLTRGVEPEVLIKSVTFIKSTIYDNQILIRQQPEYLGSLLSLPYVERMRLLEGDWDVLPEAGKVFDRTWFEGVKVAPVGGQGKDKAWDVRFWDFAATEKKVKGDDPDWTVGTRMRKYGGKYYVLDVIRVRANPGELERVVLNTASQEPNVPVRWEQEGAASGKIATNHFVEKLIGYDARGLRPMGDKLARALPLSAQAEAGNVKVVQGEWVEQWLTELHHFPDAEHDDDVDSASGAFNYLVRFGSDVTVGPDIWSS